MNSESVKAVLASFNALDPRGIWRAVDCQQASATSDAVRVALAFGEVARANFHAASRFLDELEHDCTSPSGDVTFVRGFLLAETGRLEEAARLLEGAFDDPLATHPRRTRLSAAEIRIRLGHWAEARDALLPLLGPPGNDATLEAHLLTLEMLVRSKAPREAAIELAAVADGLAERGFRLRDGRTALAMIEMLTELKVEGLPGRIADTHGAHIELIETDDAEELGYLVEAGEQYKCGAMVRAAARCFEGVDFAWPGDAEVAAFQFAQHEEFDAARLVIDRGFSKEEIAGRSDLWGPLLLACYHGGEWERTLGLLAEHATRIEGSRVEGSSRLMRAVCQLNSGDAGGSVESFGGLWSGWRSEALPHEAACLPIALAQVTGLDAAMAEIVRWLAEEARSEARSHYLNTLFNDAVARHDAGFFKLLVKVVSDLPEPGLQSKLWMLADLAMRWDMPAGAEAVGAALEGIGEPDRADYWRAMAALHPDSPRSRGGEGALAILEVLSENPDQFLAAEAMLEQARLLARSGALREAMHFAERAASLPSAARAHLAWELLGRLTLDDDAAAARAREKAQRAAVLPNVAPEVNYAREYERRTLYEEESSEGVLRLLREARERAPKSSEILRLERRLAVLSRSGTT